MISWKTEKSPLDHVKGKASETKWSEMAQAETEGNLEIASRIKI